ncbi:MAG: hypothetical protein CMJ58_00410 [Planctomycetaceae bacterium]|nr:hypothetical protein [Planctomycetaceae bacterium]
MLGKSIDRILSAKLRSVRLSEESATGQAGWETAGLPDTLTQVVLGLDNSPSMAANGGKREMGDGLTLLGTELDKDPALRNSIELAVWSFGQGAPTQMLTDFVPASRFSAPTFRDSHATWVYKLFRDSIAHLLERSRQLDEEFDCDARPGWVFVASDFQTADLEFRDAALQMKAAAAEHGLNVVLLGCGARPDERVMHELGEPGRILRMQEVKSWREFFPWLVRSLRTASRSLPGRQVDLDPIFGHIVRADV